MEKLRAHEVVHRPEEHKPYLCHQCGKGFARQEQVNRHSKMCGLKPFHCSLCGKGFGRRATNAEDHLLCAKWIRTNCFSVHSCSNGNGNLSRSCPFNFLHFHEDSWHPHQEPQVHQSFHHLPVHLVHFVAHWSVHWFYLLLSYLVSFLDLSARNCVYDVFHLHLDLRHGLHHYPQHPPRGKRQISQ